MSRILIIKTGDTVRSVPDGYGDFHDWIRQGMEQATDAVDTVNVHQGDLLPAIGKYNGVVITGSPAMVTDRELWSLHTESYIRKLKSQQIPLLGICYGHQLIAQALGGKVSFHPLGREIGTTEINLRTASVDDPLCNGLGANFHAHVSHSQTVEKLPDKAVILAANAFEKHQMVRYSDCIWGVQFHPEFDSTIMRAYLHDRKTVLASEGLPVDQLIDGVRETPDAALILLNFADFVNHH